MNNNIEDTLVTFRIGRGGRWHNPGHKTFCEHGVSIDAYAGHLFVRYENEEIISEAIGNRENLRALFEMAIDGNEGAKSRIEKATGISFGKQIYTSCDGNPVGLDFLNDGTGMLDEDGMYDTTIVCRLKECDEQELKHIHYSSNYKSADVDEHVKNALIELGVLCEDEDEDEDEGQN